MKTTPGQRERILRQVARRKVENAEILLKEALPILAAGGGLSSDVVNRLHGLFAAYGYGLAELEVSARQRAADIFLDSAKFIVTAVCERGEHGECLALNCTCSCHNVCPTDDELRDAARVAVVVDERCTECGWAISAHHPIRYGNCPGPTLPEPSVPDTLREEPIDAADPAEEDTLP